LYLDFNTNRFKQTLLDVGTAWVLMGQTENPTTWGMFAKYRVLTFFFYRLAIGQTQAQVFFAWAFSQQ
jgi:hypothetical protein